MIDEKVDLLFNFVVIHVLYYILLLQNIAAHDMHKSGARSVSRSGCQHYYFRHFCCKKTMIKFISLIFRSCVSLFKRWCADGRPWPNGYHVCTHHHHQMAHLHIVGSGFLSVQVHGRIILQMVPKT